MQSRSQSAGSGGLLTSRWQWSRAQGCCSARDIADEESQFVWFVAELVAEGDEFASFGDQLGALRRGARNGRAAAATELQQTFVAKGPQCAQNSVGVDAQDGREIAGRREALTGSGFAVGDRAAHRGGDLFMQGDRAGRGRSLASRWSSPACRQADP
jgi:hypothetical protein